MNKLTKTLLVAFYNPKALGVRYLGRALGDAGAEVITVYFMGYNSVSPKRVGETELRLLCDLIKSAGVGCVGLSVMSSMYLDTVAEVINAVRRDTNTTVICGGAYATMFDRKLLDMGSDYVLRGEGDRTLPQLIAAVSGEGDASRVPGVAFMREGELVSVPNAPLESDLDSLGTPLIGADNCYFIRDGKMTPGDPLLSSFSYEVMASRGCPFSCTYCSSPNLRRLLAPGGKYMRFRSVDSVIAELTEAKAKLRRLKFIRFYDEVFPDTPGWVDEFVAKYPKAVGLPFTIWTHPLRTDPETLKKLVSAGLYEVIMGIQTGSLRIRREIFHRYETDADIIAATERIHDAGVRHAEYDFMLRHPFESTDELRESYELVRKLKFPFKLQLHGLNFFPGSDICGIAVEQGIFTAEELERVLSAPMEEQYSVYWHKQEPDPLRAFWYELIYLSQFAATRAAAAKYATAPGRYMRSAKRLVLFARLLEKAAYLKKKGAAVLGLT